MLELFLNILNKMVTSHDAVKTNTIYALFVRNLLMDVLENNFADFVLPEIPLFKKTLDMYR